ncbi:uncharacterized protein LOC108298410 [Cebus imitator]|uniref:uncharacterized protein LOC108298410 n=1 Tax=Cebus imitator TaxID=2715852 RepID=UPI00189B0278|nr:uncharacterized protein LOC108298410 [Cebus imitator]
MGPVDLCSHKDKDSLIKTVQDGVAAEIRMHIAVLGLESQEEGLVISVTVEVKLNKKCLLGWNIWLINTTTRVAIADNLKDSAEDLVLETIDRVVVPAVLASVVVVQAAATVVEVVTAIIEDLVEVAMEASTTVKDMEEIMTSKGLTGGATESALHQSHPYKQANMETTCNLARLYRVASRTCSTLPALIVLKIQGSSKSQEEKRKEIKQQPYSEIGLKT